MFKYYKMSYSLLGSSCTPQTMYMTSNHKFLPLRASIYKKQFTYMMQYPGTNVTNNLNNPVISSNVSPEHPEILKSYNGSCKNC